MFLEAVILGLVIGFLRGGRFSNLSKIHIKGGAFLVFLLLLQFTMVFWARISWLVPYRIGISFGLSVLIFCVSAVSLARPSLFLVPIGAFLNILAMAFNHLKMPVSMPLEMTSYFTTLKSGILSQEIFNYTLFSSAHPIFRFLGKIVLMPDWYYGFKMLSVGDMIISIGLMLFIQSEMNNTLYYRRQSTHGFSGYRKTY